MFATLDEQAIVAQCTPQGAGALAIIRISGAHAIGISNSFAKLASGKPLKECDSHTVHYGHILSAEGKFIDAVMFTLMRTPRSFTGEDTVEITCHNNPFIIQEIIQQAITHGARLAGPGEFTKRAFLNKKIDLLAAEAINEVIHAATPMALKQSLAQLEGSFSSWIVEIEQLLLKALSLAHASLEFLDEEISFDAEIGALIGAAQEKIATTKSQFNAQQHIRQGIRVAIIGSVNAGKSSLFNALLNKERAIVTPMAGTTRDTIEAGVYKEGIYWTIIDTAGLRETDNAIEQEGINRSYQEAALADIILLVIDSSRKLSPHESTLYQDFLIKYQSKVIPVHHKIDLPALCQTSLSSTTPIAVSSLTRTNIETLETALLVKAQALMQKADAPFLLNKRHFNLLIALENQLTQLKHILTPPFACELVIYHLAEALGNIGELTGKSISETAVDAIFKEFCVGK